MRRWWSADELVERWSLTPEDLSLLVGRIDAGKLGLAAQLVRHTRNDPCGVRAFQRRRGKRKPPRICTR